MDLIVKSTKGTGGLKAEIERRTKNTSKLIEIEAQKLAVGEMVVERLDTILDLLRSAGFKVTRVREPRSAFPPVAAQNSPPVAVAGMPGAAPEPPRPPIKNPCVMCGQEATHWEDVPGGGKKFYCRPHRLAREKEKAEEQEAAKLFGNSGTLYPRAVRPQTVPPQKTVIHPEPDLLKANFNGEPPPNHVLDEE